MNIKDGLIWVGIIVIGSVIAIAILSLLPIAVPGIPTTEDVFTSFTAIVLGFTGIYLSLKSMRIDELELVRDRREILLCKQKFHGILDTWLSQYYYHGTTPNHSMMQAFISTLTQIEDSCGSLYPPIVELRTYLSAETAIQHINWDAPENVDPLCDKIARIQKELRRELDPILRQHGSNLERGKLPSRWRIRVWKLKSWLKDGQTR